MISAVGIKRILFADIDKVTADIRMYTGKRGRLRKRKPPSLGTRTN